MHQAQIGRLWIGGVVVCGFVQLLAEKEGKDACSFQASEVDPSIPART